MTQQRPGHPTASRIRTTRRVHTSLRSLFALLDAHPILQSQELAAEARQQIDFELWARELTEKVTVATESST